MREATAKSLILAMIIAMVTSSSTTLKVSSSALQAQANPEGYHVVHNPYEQVDWDTWFELKTQLHCHTTLSDGSLTPAQLIDAYKAKGYDALGISDHDTLAVTPTWPWTNWGRDPKTLDMLDIPNNELSKYHDTLSVFSPTLISEYANTQQAIDKTLEQGGMPILAHPWRYIQSGRYNFTEYDSWTGFEGIEIFNSEAGRGELKEDDFALWDRLLTNPKREKPVWGFATDDASSAPSINDGWIRVYAPEKTKDSLKMNIKAGRFLTVRYKETAISSIRQVGRQLIINATESVVWKANNQVIVGTTNSLNLDELGLGYTYIRAEVGSGPTFTQPIFIQLEEKKPLLVPEYALGIVIIVTVLCFAGVKFTKSRKRVKQRIHALGCTLNS